MGRVVIQSDDQLLGNFSKCLGIRAGQLLTRHSLKPGGREESSGLTEKVESQHGLGVRDARGQRRLAHHPSSPVVPGPRHAGKGYIGKTRDKGESVEMNGLKINLYWCLVAYWLYLGRRMVATTGEWSDTRSSRQAAPSSSRLKIRASATSSGSEVKM